MKDDHATVNRDGYEVPLIGLPKDVMEVSSVQLSDAEIVKALGDRLVNFSSDPSKHSALKD